MRRLIAAILFVAVLAVGGGIIATTAYQAGFSTAVTTATGTGATVVTPVVVPTHGFGYGWNPFGWVFGFFATVFFLFIVFGLLRAVFWRGGPGRGGWGGAGWDGPGHDGHNRSRWEARSHETFDDWHRRAHGDAPATGPSDPTPPTGVA